MERRAPTAVQQPTEPPPVLVESPVRSEEKSLVSGFGFSEAQGLRPTMEDNHTMIENFGGKPGQSFFAIYDRHGGKEVADFAAKTLHLNLLDQLDLGVEPKQTLGLAYAKIDQQLVILQELVNNLAPQQSQR